MVSVYTVNTPSVKTGDSIKQISMHHKSVKNAAVKYYNNLQYHSSKVNFTFDKHEKHTHTLSFSLSTVYKQADEQNNYPQVSFNLDAAKKSDANLYFNRS